MAVNQVTQDVKPIQAIGIAEFTKNWRPSIGVAKNAPIIEEEVTNTDYEQAKKDAIAQRDEEWARADAIRKETQEREDNAVQRWTEDAKKAGINIGALGAASAAASGGGITSETGSIDYTMTEAKYNAEIELLMQEIDQKFQGSENEKERIKELIKTLLAGGAILANAGTKSAKK